MAIDCLSQPDPALDYPQKLYQHDGMAGKESSQGKAHMDPLKDKTGPWATYHQVMNKGTATEDKEGLATGNCFITHPESENNQEICPSSQNRHRYSVDSKQYSLSDSFEQIPNNVVNDLEGKLACGPRSPKGKGRKSKRKKRVRDGQRRPTQSGQRIPEEESRVPIPVQDDDFQPSLLSDSKWLKDGKKDIPPHNKKDYPHTEELIHKDERIANFYKLINPSQFICHVGEEKLKPTFSAYTSSFPDPHVKEINKDLELDANFGLDWEDINSPTLGSLKLSSPCMDLKNHSVEEWTLQALRGSVSVGEPRNLCAIARDWKKVDEDEVNMDNEGVLLTEVFKPVDYEYREGVHWTKCGPALGSGSFGDVFPAKDEKTGFTFAAKKIHISKFRAEELTRSLHIQSQNIVPLYGAVREGPWVTILMQQLKGGSIGQLIKRNGFLPEDRALHYLGQVLDALIMLHAAAIVHGDIKADNVLLSEDGHSVHLCDFGHAAHLPRGGSKKQLLTGDFVPGTQTHMAPEIARGDPCDGGLDVWSALCMLLHMLNGWHPWSRTHTQPLCYKIATEPAPLQEIPPDSSPLTRELITTGLEKEPARRPTPAQLKEKVDLALYQIGGLRSPYNSEYREPRTFPPTSLTPTRKPEVTFPEPQLPSPKPRAVPGSPSDEKPGDPPLYSHCSLENVQSFCDLEILKLGRDLFLESLSHSYSPEEQEQMLSCLSESSLEPELSCKTSTHTCDTTSSGIHSWDSYMDHSSFQSDSPFNGGDIATPSYFNGVKVQVKTLSGETLRIWESHKTKLGDLALGISFQIPFPTFTLLTQEGSQIPWDTELADCGAELLCSLALDDGGGWSWRVKRGRLEESAEGEVYAGGGGRPG